MIRVMLVDDQELLRAGFRMVLAAQPDIEVVAEAGDGAAALELLETTEVDVVLMDVRMPVMDGVEATSRIQGPKVLILTTFDLDEYAFAAVKAGAAGFLLKDVPPADLVEAIKIVHAGDSVVSPSTLRRMLDRFAAQLPTDEPVAAADLTPREREVLLMVARGLSNMEIAGGLQVAEATVKTHLGRVLAKLGLRDRAQVVVYAYEAGLIVPSHRPKV
ncbi:response regulator transcription factor [Nonomuraea jabiensis]|uniref:DNA-binding NarL/FixJ family response regulator n=1 Tax=Nonomuraea jabiensis TaxID=882448 RepID=A0A7W9LBQ2_9ACTN|nr:response regulator transcription factor [Nonomuraea jabiensis]MBB5777940.1 DNA-binding NarL/FixJ family response regulator [Nonomuraea jabiensis]